MKNKITIFIPTHNRHHYLNRALNYYRKFKLPIVICDSSTIRYENEDPDITYEHYPDISYYDKINYSLVNIDTEYILFCTDDDFVVQNGLKESFKFLENNIDYASVQGHAVYYTSYDNKLLYAPYQINSIGLDINKEKPIDRMVQLSLPTPVYVDFSLFRTQNVKNIYSTISKLDTNIYVICEYCTQLLAVLEGKHKVLPILFLFREWYHKSSGYVLENFTEIVQTEDGLSALELAKDVLSKYINNKYQEDIEESKLSVELIFENYFKSSQATREDNNINNTTKLNKKEFLEYNKTLDYFPNEKNMELYLNIENTVAQFFYLYEKNHSTEKDILNKIPKDTNIAIYGAGIPGFFVESLINKYRDDLNIKYFIDDFIGGQFNGIDIIGLDPDKIDNSILILISPTQFIEVMELRLKEKLFENYLFINRMIFDF